MEKLCLNNFSFSYDNKKNNPVLSGISVEIKKGDFVCLCGPNGAGKSTLLKSLSDASGITNAKERAKRISFLVQNESALWDYSVFESVLSGRFCHTGALGNFSKKDYEKVEEVIKEFGLESIKEKSVHEISGGEFQKVRLARSFVQGSDFLLLDEPLSSLDFTAAKNFMSLLKEKCKKSDKAVILSIHDINTACAFADKIILLGKCRERKQLFFVGNVNQVMTSKNLSLVYESTVQIFAHPLLGVPQV